MKMIIEDKVLRSDTFPEPAESRLIGCSTGSIWNPESKSNMSITPKNQLLLMLTKGSFTRDEWSHLLRLFNLMIFSMFSCSNFFSIKSQAQSRRELKKEGQKKNLGECEASMFGIQKLGCKHPSSLDSDVSYSLVNQGLGRNTVFMRTGSPPAQRDDNPFSSAGDVREMSEPTCKDEVEPPQSINLQQSVP